MSETNKLHTTAEVASLLRVSRATVARMCKDGQLQPLRLSKRTLRFAAADVNRLLEAGGRA